jgi:hypothetical protein
MKLRFQFGALRPSYLCLLAACFLAATALLVSNAEPADNPPGDAVGTIEGDTIAVTGPMSVEAVHGQVKTILRSGSDVHVKSGNARIDLVEGGQIFICGPAHLSVLKSGGSLTVALDTGTVHAHIENGPALTIYTPQILAKPIAIGDGPQDMLIGFETPGAMCIRANRGAIRIEQQLTGQSIVIPQSGDVTMTNGQLESLRNTSGTCACEIQLSNAAPQTEVSRIATAEEAHRDFSDAKPTLPSPGAEKPMPKDEPIYQVYVPPLIFDAKAKVQPEIDPKLIVLVRRVRVRPTLIFQGRVEGPPPATVATPLAAAVAAAGTTPPAKPATPASDSIMDRAKRFLRKLWPPTS